MTPAEMESWGNWTRTLRAERDHLKEINAKLVTACEAAGSLCENIMVGAHGHHEAAAHVRGLIDAALVAAIAKAEGESDD